MASTVTVITPADLSADFDVVNSQVAIVPGTQTTAGKVQFATPQQLANGAVGVAVDPHDVQSVLSGNVPALAGLNGIKIVLINGVNTIESTLGDGSRTILV
jgi:hypothetical protein